MKSKYHKIIQTMLILAVSLFLVPRSISYASKETHADTCFHYVELRQFRKAISACSALIEKTTDEKMLSAIYTNRGIAYKGETKYAEAILDYTTAIRLYPENYKAFNNRGIVLSLSGNYIQAARDFEKALEINPSYFIGMYNLACLYSEKNEIDLACTWLLKAVEKGYKNYEQIMTDSSLDNLRDQKCFKAIVKNLSQNK